MFLLAPLVLCLKLLKIYFVCFIKPNYKKNGIKIRASRLSS
uniref:Uncharacterized protein n=1 Tax=Siphoviridae sp. ctiJI15 TaxID=2826431 RepID=A0A8S5NJD5_9CAUD|nr:MAG TPA: hypothetical protein [Siphoviridae sp. ctiJI15]DAJ13867.1 MAG TPA: hypothetical protein [Siphoviridae sp. ctvzh6]DAP59164.1 MAG TPA: hypothetical protein [Caudoviricetes sp.]